MEIMLVRPTYHYQYWNRGNHAHDFHVLVLLLQIYFKIFTNQEQQA